jgi:hypothetical protein
MSWVAVGTIVVGAVSGARTQKAAEQLGAAKAKYENASRENENALDAANVATANITQSIANRRRLDAAGANFARAGEALARSQEAATANSFSRRVQAAEQAGEAVAMAAFSGVTGGSVSTLVSTAALRGEMVEELGDRQQEQQEYELRKNAAEQLSGGIEGLDQRLIRPNMDVGVSTNQAPQAGSVLDNLAPLLLKYSGTLVGAASSYFGSGTPKGYAGGDTNNSFFGGNRGSGD